MLRRRLLVLGASLSIIMPIGAFFLAQSASASGPTTPPFTECPAVGDDTSCGILIVINDNGAQILTDPSQGPYDGVEDTLIGVLNNTTSTTITNIPVSGTSDVFGFDLDGVCANPNPTSGLAGADCSGNTQDTTGYGGPDSFFTNDSSGTSGTVNFINPLGPGQSTFFSLEGAINGSDINIVSATAVPVAATEGNAFSGTVANFNATDTTTLAAQYTATINWGDGSPLDTGTVSGGGGSFTVSGTHTYTDENAASSATVTITDTSNGNTTTVQSPVTVADAPLSVSAASLTGTEGQSTGSVTVANFIDGNPLATTADFTSGGGSVTIDWGDGTTSAGTVTQTGTGQFSVSGSHTYVDEGSYPVQVTVADDGGAAGAATGSAVIADAPLAATGSPAFVSTNPVSATLATFTDANPLATTADFTSGGGSVTIDWGDGTTSAGTVTQTGTGQFSVSGSHSYAALGPYTITVSIVDDGGSTASATTSVIVYAFPPGGDFVIGDGDFANGASVTFWAAQWDQDNTLTGGAAAFKGFENSLVDPSCPATWTAATGNSSPPPAGPLPTYMGVIVSGSIGQSGSTISGNVEHVVVVATNAGYEPNPGHAGTGTVVAQVC
jgi:hypothetical protein